jgi:23S rRNA pseudouridine1911/1915/1917 synthase
VKVNGVRTDKDVTLCVGDKVEIFYKPISNKGYSVVFADENIVVVNKKSGYTAESVFSSMQSEYASVFFIHRLDRNTSGLMIFALNEQYEII